MTKTESLLVGTFDETVEKMMKDLHVPGAAIAVMKDGEVIISKGFGYRDLKKKEPVTPQTRFAIGSTTKAFGTLSLSLLTQQQKFEWDAPVRSYIPSFSLSDLLASENVTARDLACHRLGINRHDILWSNFSLTRKDIAEKMKYLPLEATFRGSFLYNNLAYATISYIAEEITNQTWEEYVMEHILQPLQMEQTNFSVTNSQRTDNYALPYTMKDDCITEISFRNIDVVGAAGCINSTIEDMSKWILFHLNGGKVGEHELISKELLQEMYAPHNPVPDQPILSTPESPVNSYGLGWFISAYRGYKMIHHSGGIDGFSAFASFMPNDNIGIVVLTNTTSSLFPTYITNQIYDTLLELDEIDWQKRAVEDTKKLKEIMQTMDEGLPKKVENTTPSKPLKNYVGTFEHPAYETLEVYKRNEQLYVKFMTMEAPLQHYHYNMFYAEFNLFQNDMKFLLSYDMNIEGNFETIQLHMPAMLSAKPLTFTKKN